jgi:hypothetical protein
MSSQAEHSKNLPLAKGREQLLITSPAMQIRLGRKYCEEVELLPLLLAHGVVQEAREVRDSTDQDTKRARTTEHMELILVSPQLQTLLGKKECSETELLPLLLTHGYIRSVRTVRVQVRPLSGNDFHVTLEATKPSVGETKREISRTHGTKVEQQELYKIAVLAGGGVVREDDAEPELLEDMSMVLEDGDLVAMAVKGLVWQPSTNFDSSNDPHVVLSGEGELEESDEAHVVLSEEGELATNTWENDDEGNYTMVVSGLEVSEGQHYWEVEIVGKPEFCHRHTCMLPGELHIGVCTPALIAEGGGNGSHGRVFLTHDEKSDSPDRAMFYVVEEEEKIWCIGTSDGALMSHLSCDKSRSDPDPGMEDMFGDPEIMAAMQNPAVMEALDAAQNGDMSMLQECFRESLRQAKTKDPVVAKALDKLQGAMNGEPGSYEQGDRVGVLLDLDNGSLLFFKNGVQHGTGYPAGSVTGPVMVAARMSEKGHSVRLHSGVGFPAGMHRLQ